MRLGIVIVNYNTKEVLVDCLKNLQKLCLENSGVVVVDNGSSDGSAAMVAKDFDWVKLVRNQNTGLAAGYNLGMKGLPDVDYYLFLGTDTFPSPGCIEGVLKFIEETPETGIATAQLKLRNGALDMDAHRGFPTPWAALTHFSGLDRSFPKSRIFNQYFMGWCDLQKPHEIDLCISHFMLVKKSVFEKIGGWDEDFFVYGEDVDLCWRAKQSGFKIYYLPQFECLHYKGVSVGTRKESEDVSRANEITKKRMKSETTRAMRLFYQKHMYTKYPWIVNKVVEFGISTMAKLRN